MATYILGVLTTLILGFFVNLYTPKVADWLAKRNYTKAAERARDVREEYTTMLSYNVDKPKLQTLILGTILRVAYIASLGGLIAGSLVLANNSILRPERFFVEYDAWGNLTFHISLQAFLLGLAQLSIVLSTLIVIRVCRAPLHIFYRVRDFDAYETKVETLLTELGKAEPKSGS